MFNVVVDVKIITLPLPIARNSFFYLRSFLPTGPWELGMMLEEKELELEYQPQGKWNLAKVS
jgi:hypothetical protein